MKRTILIISLAVVALPAIAAVTTNVAPSGAIIDSSTSYDAWLTPARAIDGQINEAPNVAAGYWLGKPGGANGYFILDLKRDYAVKSVAIYNTHNRGSNDWGTAQFALTASDAVGPNFVSLDRYYPFEGNVNDASTNAVPAVMVDSFLSPIDPVFSNDVPAAVKTSTRSLAFSGFGESLEIADPAGFTQPTSYSYALWVKFLVTDSQPTLLPTSLVLRTAAAGQERSTWSHQLRLNTALKFEAYAFDGALKTVTGTTVVQPGVWYHVACTVQNGALLHLYVNGKEEGTPVAVNALWTGGSMTEVGTGSGGGFQSAAELIDDLAIWYSALSPDRILSLSQGKSPLEVGGASGLVLINPKAVASGTLSAVTGQAQITPQVFTLSTPVTARYFRFDALSMAYPATGTNGIGLNEIQLMADADLPTLSSAPAVQVSWRPNPFAAAPLVGPSLTGTNWTPLPAAPLFDGVNFTYFQPTTNSTMYFKLPSTSNGAMVTTNIARAGAIIGASSTYNDTFTAANVIDGQTDEAPTSPATYWLAGDRVTTADFTLDLRRSYSIKSVSLFNTHNRQYNDRGTAGFELWAGDGFTTTSYPTNLVDRYYPFDGDVTDHSGNLADAMVLDGPNGFVIPGTFAPDTPAPVGSGQGIVFSQTGARLEILDVAGTTQPTAFSISLWVKFSDLSQASSIIVRTVGSGSESNSWSHQIRVTETGQFQAYLWDGAERAVTGTTVAQPNTWYHVVATALNGDSEHLYVNGKEEGTPAPIGTLWAGGDRWTIGTGSGAGYGPLAGEVDDLALWFSVLPADVVRDMASGSKPNTVRAATIVTEMLNSRLILSGTLSDVSSQDSITPDTFTLPAPQTARLLQFKTLSSIYGSNVGLNEIEAFADAAGSQQTIGPAVLLTWPYTPFNVVLESSPDSTTWTPVAATPTLVGATWSLYQPVKGPLFYRLTPR